MTDKMIDHDQAIKGLFAESYLLGELSENEREAYEDHLFNCPVCFEQVKRGSEFIDHLSRVGAEQPAVVAASVPANNWRHFVQQILRPSPALAFAALFVCVSGVSLYQARIIQKSKDPQVLSSLTLKAARKEGGNVLTVGSDGVFALHFLFEPKPEYVSYVGQISNDPDAGKGISFQKSFSISARDAQEAVTVRLSSSEFREGSYALAVSGITTDGKRENIANYSFELRFQK